MALTGLTNLQPLHVHSIGISTFDGSVSVGGTLTYEDVTNVDSIGIITARSGINISDTTQSSSTTTGALKVAGGVGVVKNLQVGGSITGIGSMVLSSNATFTASSGYSVIANGSSTGIGLGSNGIIVFGSQNIAAYGPGVFDATQYQFKTSGYEKLRITSGGELVFAGDTDTFIDHPNANQIEITAGNIEVATFIDGQSNRPAMLIDKGGVNNTTAGHNYNSNGNSNDLVVGNVSSGNHGITICSPSNAEGSLNYSDGSGGGADAYRGTVAFNHTDEKMIVRAKTGKVVLRNDATDTLVATGGKIGIGTDTFIDGNTKFEVRGKTSNTSAGGQNIHKYGSASAFHYGQYNSTGDASLNNQANALLAFATGNTTRMEISAGGRITKPYQVAWAMHGSAAQDVTGGTRLNFNVNGSGFGNFSNRNHGGVDTTNNSYTVPVTGLYSITLTLFCYTNNNTNTFSIVPFKNGTAMHNGSDTIFILGASSTNANVTYSGTILLQLNAGDEIDLRRRPGEAGTSRVYLPHSHFSGFLVG